jgi:hypothetical protein
MNTIETSAKPTKFPNIVRHAPQGFYNRKPSYTGTGNSGKTYLISSNGTWYSTYINNKSTAIGYKLDEVSASLKQL